MDASTMLSGIPLAIFLVVGTLAIASAILVVFMRNPVHSALFLLVTFLCVAILFVLMGAEFVGAVQVLVYAGGIMVLFLFVVMLINVKHLPQEKMFSPVTAMALVMGVLLFLMFAIIVVRGDFATPINAPDNVRSTMTAVAGAAPQMQVVGNSEAVGMALYREYLVPFEVASLFLLVAMIGAIVIGKRELGGEEEESIPGYMAQKVHDEKRVKETRGA